MIPSFAVVGHPNKGKSSIVATLAEDDAVAIQPDPGTTRTAHRYTFSVDGDAQYVLVDTPGFQRARAVLDWLQARAGSASERPALVARFVDEHAADARFHDECELLRPIVEGAGILYVVDGAKPYGPEYELEMQVLRWTGRPRMALINLIGEGDYVEAWRHGLGQYFSIVRVFDAVRADFSKRLALLNAFAELDESWRPALDRAVAALTGERQRRRQRAAREIADCLAECLEMTERQPLADGAAAASGRADLEARLQARLRDRIRARERDCRDRVQSIYRHRSLRREDATDELLGSDVFSSEGWELFGLSRTELVVSGLVSGAVAGGGLDVLLGGASLLMGSGLGALVGGAGAWLGGSELARVKVLGRTLGGRVLQVGPVKAPNFPWVLLGRAWVHHRLVAERNHAGREAMSVQMTRAMAEEQHMMDTLPDALRKSLARVFQRLRRDPGDAAARGDLVDAVAQLLTVDAPLDASGPEPPSVSGATPHERPGP